MRLLGAIVLAIIIGACGQGPAPTPAPAANVPCGPSEVLTRHEHAHLTILVRGQIKTVPAFIGITATQICWLHTHDTSGIIHMEATKKYPFTLGQFFAIWDVHFTDSELGPFKPAGGKKLQVYDNGKPVTNPVALVMHEHDNIVVGYGKPGSFPTEPPANFPSGL